MYEQIADVPTDRDAYASSELEALAHVWSERKTEMAETGAYKDFLKRLQREWAIETGIIERLYTWDRGVTEALIEQGIEATVIAHQGGIRREEADHIKDIINDQLEIVEGLFGYIKGEQPLSEHFIRSLQAQFTAHQDFTEAVTPDDKIVKVPLVKGAYKSLPNNPRRRDGTVHKYCPPELVNDEMGRLVAWYRHAEESVSPELLSAWLHHRFTQIHPFQDGNGRVARALASLVFLRAGLFPLVIRDADRVEYISALERADQGDLHPLVTLFVRRQRDAILMALGIEQQAQQARHAEQIISSAIQVLRDKFAAETHRIREVYATADRLGTIAFERVTSISQLLDKELRGVTPRNHSSYYAKVRRADNASPDRAFFYNQIVDIAKQFKYYANFDKYRSWIRLAIVTESTFEFVISFHAYGSGETGVMAASAFTALRIPREEGDGTETANTRPSCTDLFQFNYAEQPESTEKRFREWLESSVAIALAEWRRQLAG